MKSFMSAVHHRYRDRISRKTAKLDPNVRSSLAQEIESSLVISGAPSSSGQEEQDELQQITTSLKEARAKLEKFEKSETFISLRVKSYRRTLQHQRDALIRSDRQRNKEESDESNVALNQQSEDQEAFSDEENIEKESSEPTTQNGAKWAKLCRDDQALEKVIETHKDLMANVESMRRNVHELECKREKVMSQREECREFLMAANVADQMEHSAYAEIQEEEDSQQVSDQRRELRQRKTETTVE